MCSEPGKDFWISRDNVKPFAYRLSLGTPDNNYKIMNEITNKKPDIMWKSMLFLIKSDIIDACLKGINCNVNNIICY